MTANEVTIRDQASGSVARIAPELGFNCFSFQAATAAEPLEVLWSDPEFTSGQTKPARSGIPILFPFAGRIRGTSFAFAGKGYSLEVGDDFGNAIHGFVLRRAWRIIEQSPARVVGEFHASVDDAALLDSWPADFRIRASYELSGSSLLSTISICNPDDRPLPFGLGTHGYFRVPLGSSGDRGACLISVPVSERWELGPDLLPIGRRSAVGGELARGVPFDQTKFDDVFDGLKTSAGFCTARIDDPQSGRVLTVKFSDQYRACVVFNPPHREAICIEPYTTIPDAFTLQAKGVDTGLRVLGPGESFEAQIEMRLE